MYRLSYATTYSLTFAKNHGHDANYPTTIAGLIGPALTLKMS